jgi:hypothetical protein
MGTDTSRCVDQLLCFLIDEIMDFFVQIFEAPTESEAIQNQGDSPSLALNFRKILKANGLLPK